MEFKKGWEFAELLRLLYKLRLIDYSTLDKLIDMIQIKIFEYEKNT